MSSPHVQTKRNVAPSVTCPTCVSLLFEPNSAAGAADMTAEREQKWRPGTGTFSRRGFHADLARAIQRERACTMARECPSCGGTAWGAAATWLRSNPSNLSGSFQRREPPGAQPRLTQCEQAQR